MPQYQKWIYRVENYKYGKKLKNGQSKSAVQEIRDFYVGLLSKDE